MNDRAMGDVEARGPRVHPPLPGAGRITLDRVVSPASMKPSPREFLELTGFVAQEGPLAWTSLLRPVGQAALHASLLQQP